VACLSKGENKSDDTQINAAQNAPQRPYCRRILAGKRPYYLSGRQLGVIEVDPSSNRSDSALRAADVAMYQDKKGKSKTRFLTMD
jgi:diguanylate cyclase